MPGPDRWSVRYNKIEFFGAADGRPAVAHAEFAVDVLGVRPHRVQRHRQGLRDFRAAQFGAEQLQHFQFAFAQRLNHFLIADCLDCWIAA